jgi:uncharacterized protein (TIGR02594 family)
MSLAAYESLGKQLGLNERDQKAALSEYLATGGVNLDPAVTAWCAAAVNAALEQSGVEGTGKLNARSFLDWGQEVTDPQKGDVAVFSRGDPNGWQGHVGFFDGYNPDGTIRVLGGNQGDSVSVASYSPDSLLGFRRAGGETGNPPGNALRGPDFNPNDMRQERANALMAYMQPQQAPEPADNFDIFGAYYQGRAASPFV